LFQTITIPDFGLLHHFPRPEHYDREYAYADDEPRHPDDIHIFTKSSTLVVWTRCDRLDRSRLSTIEMRDSLCRVWIAGGDGGGV
jgi:hypothetical protein